MVSRLLSQKLEVMMQPLSCGRPQGLAIAAAALAFWLVALPAAAHHGWGGYVDALSDISGTVESSVNMAGPHASMKLKAADGKVWDVVLAPPAGSERSGLKNGMIPVGDKVVVHGQRHRDPNKLEIKTTRLTWNGKVFSVYPDRD
jgi:hypothetical protein